MTSPDGPQVVVEGLIVRHVLNLDKSSHIRGSPVLGGFTNPTEVTTLVVSHWCVSYFTVTIVQPRSIINLDSYIF